MRSIKELVESQLGENTPGVTSTPVSFRCSQEIILKMDLLTKHLGFSTRSKMLAEIVPLALNEAAAHLPHDMQGDFCIEYDEKLRDLHEEYATRDL